MMREGDGETSMEDELASFQEAASLFSDVVAVQAREEDVSPPKYDDVLGRGDEKRPDGW